MVIDYTFITDKEQSVKKRPPFPGTYIAYVRMYADPGKVLKHKITNSLSHFVYTTETQLTDWEEVLDETE